MLAVPTVRRLDPKRLLNDLRRQVGKLEGDLRDRSNADAAFKAQLQEEYHQAHLAGRTGEAYEMWRETTLTQAAVAWVLGGVFVRFLEDNDLIEPVISGPTPERRDQAHEEELAYFRVNPAHSAKDYLLHVFQGVARYEAGRALFDRAHNPLWAYIISGDAAKGLLKFWRDVNPDTGELVHDFTDGEWDTRFLGDLYQNLSDSVREKYALLQTPEFVEEFILERTLQPAIDTFGLGKVRMIDPTCGSGHFLLGAFRMLLDQHLKANPGLNERVLVQKSLHAVHGVDINPYAVAIAKFRLLVAALKASQVRKLSEAPGFELNLAVGDTLLFGPSKTLRLLPDEAIANSYQVNYAYQHEDLGMLKHILGQPYHAVVGNPPYITVKDKVLNALYRQRYLSCHMKYSLGVPFTECFFELAVRGDNGKSAGFIGMITADSFMKREFGKKLVSEFFPKVNLTHVISTSGAYIPGHGTPTVILLGQHETPVSTTVRAVMGIKGEPSTPVYPSEGLVWQAILDQLDRPGSASEFISVAEVPRETLAKHPWSLGGGGAAELKELIETRATYTLGNQVDCIGFGCIISEEEAFFLQGPKYRQVSSGLMRRLVEGDAVRDWCLGSTSEIFFPYNSAIELISESDLGSALWRCRALLENRADFSKKSYKEIGRPYYEYHQIPKERNRTPLTITFSEVSTHNHFVLDRGGKVFKQTAPVIKLKPEATLQDYWGLLGILNSSTACFWFKQVCHCKGNGGINGGIASELWEKFYVFNGTTVAKFPLVGLAPMRGEQLDMLARRLSKTLPDNIVEDRVPTVDILTDGFKIFQKTFSQMIAIQEELDWHAYKLYGLVDDNFEYPSPPPLNKGERAFEIHLARQLVTGQVKTSWFERHGSTPITEIPAHWPEDYKAIVEKRIAAIENNPNITLIERPEYKRRWSGPSWEEQEKGALKGWLLDRLETPDYWPEVRLQFTRELANRAQADEEFRQVADLYMGSTGYDMHALVSDLVLDEAVPYLPILRYKESGLIKRAVWERTWDLQRAEDRGDSVGGIPVPPKYKSSDFLSNSYWRLRGGLDVPKERFISYLYAERTSDPKAAIIGWAGWNHLQQANALFAYYMDIQEHEGWGVERLTPLLAGLRELVPWLKQWHNDLDPETGYRLGDYWESTLAEEIHSHGLTEESFKNWQPPATTSRRGRKPKES